MASRSLIAPIVPARPGEETVGDNVQGPPGFLILDFEKWGFQPFSRIRVLGYSISPLHLGGGGPDPSPPSGKRGSRAKKKAKIFLRALRANVQKISWGASRQMCFIVFFMHTPWGWCPPNLFWMCKNVASPIFEGLKWGSRQKKVQKFFPSGASRRKFFP